MLKRIEQIRESEKSSHIVMYSSTKLYEQGTWLAKPIKSVEDLSPYLDRFEKLRILDLGCGVGRNSIQIAQRYKKNAQIDCVDILDFAIEKLLEYCEIYDVSSCVNGIVSSIEDFVIEKDKYHLIMAVSALEHISNYESFYKKLIEIKYGVINNGIICLVINSQVEEKNKETNNQIEPQFEVNMTTQELKNLLNEVFSGWKILKHTETNQSYEIPREECTAIITTTVVTIVAQNTH